MHSIYSKYQEESLRDILKYVNIHVPKYQKCIIDFLSNRRYSCYLQHLPIIEKEEIKKNIYSYMSDEIVRENDIEKMIETKGKDFGQDYIYKCRKGKILYFEYTSGTTGIPFFSIKSMDERIILGRTLWDFRNQFIHLQPNELFCLIHNNGVYNFPFEEGIGINGINKELSYLSDATYKMWHMFPSQIECYYNYLLQHPYSFKNLKYIEYNGAYLSKIECEQYEKVFKCKLVNNYGCREVWNMAYEGKEGELEVNDKTILFELVDNEGREITQCYKEGYVVVTSLVQRMMPFIRYKTGDKAMYIDERNLKKIKLVPSRSLILGTNIDGNQYFRGVIADLVQYFKISDFSAINIVQEDVDTFRVNIKGHKGDEKIIEKKFVICANGGNRLPLHKWKYRFTYDEELKCKGLFSCAL